MKNFSQQKQAKGYDQSASFLTDGIDRRNENDQEEDTHKISDTRIVLQKGTEDKHEHHGDEQEEKSPYPNISKWNTNISEHIIIHLRQGPLALVWSDSVKSFFSAPEEIKIRSTKSEIRNNFEFSKFEF